MGKNDVGNELRRESAELIDKLQQSLSEFICGTDDRIALPPGAEAVIGDGRFLIGTSKIGPRTVFRPAFSNWRTRSADVEELANVVLDVAESLSLPRAAGESR